MTQAIQFLEQLGRNPASIQLRGDALRAAIDGLDASADERDALRACHAPGAEPGARVAPTLYCMLTTPDQEAPARSPDEAPQDDEPRRDPDRDDRGAERAGH